MLTSSLHPARNWTVQRRSLASTDTCILNYIFAGGLSRSPRHNLASPVSCAKPCHTCPPSDLLFIKPLNGKKTERQRVLPGQRRRNSIKGDIQAR